MKNNPFFHVSPAPTFDSPMVKKVLLRQKTFYVPKPSIKSINIDDYLLGPIKEIQLNEKDFYFNLDIGRLFRFHVKNGKLPMVKVNQRLADCSFPFSSFYGPQNKYLNLQQNLHTLNWSKIPHCWIEFPNPTSHQEIRISAQWYDIV